MPAHAPMARARSVGSRKTSLMMDSDEGIINAAPTPIHSSARNKKVYRIRECSPDRARSKGPKAKNKEALATEAVSEASADQQQPGKDHCVRIDDPLQLARAGV